MKTKCLLFLSVFFLSFNGFAQGLYVTKYSDLDYSGYASISELDKTTGEVIYNHVFSTDYVGMLTYDATTNEIYAISGDYQIIKYNILTKTETYFPLPDSPEMYFLYNMIIANGRLFVTRGDYFGKTTLLELNKTTGEVIDSYDFNTTNDYVWGLTYDASNNEIYAISSCDKIIKYNILTKTETYFYLPNLSEIYYYSVRMIIVDGRLFLTREDDSVNSFILELNKTTGEVIDTYVFSTTNHAPIYVSYNASTNEIYGMARGMIEDIIIIKYNIATKTETYVSMPDMYYSGMIIVDDNTSDVNTILSNEGSKPVRAFNLFGQEVPLNTNSLSILFN